MKEKNTRKMPPVLSTRATWNAEALNIIVKQNIFVPSTLLFEPPTTLDSIVWTSKFIFANHLTDANDLRSPY